MTRVMPRADMVLQAREGHERKSKRTQNTRCTLCRIASIRLYSPLGTLFSVDNLFEKQSLEIARPPGVCIDPHQQGLGLALPCSKIRALSINAAEHVLLTSAGRHDYCRTVAVYFSKCIPAQTRSTLQEAVERLGGSVVTDDSFTHFVTCPAEKGSQDRGFVKSLNLLIALAAGEPPAVYVHAAATFAHHSHKPGNAPSPISSIHTVIRSPLYQKRSSLVVALDAQIHCTCFAVKIESSLQAL